MNDTFTLSPMSQDIELESGQTYIGYITISNPADSISDFAYQISVNPFSVVGEDYSADLITEHDRSVITDWITVMEPTGTLKPNESKKVEYIIKVPENAPSGGQYAALTISSDPDTTGSDDLVVKNIIEMASIIYARIAGETVHEGQILENQIPGFIATPPAKLTAIIQNTGNVHDLAQYTITVSDFFTGQVILPTSETDGHYTEIIMPGSTYLSQREISNLPAVGIVKVTQTIRFNNQVSTVEGNIFICPIWFIFLVLATLAALIATIILILRKHRRRCSSESSI